MSHFAYLDPGTGSLVIQAIGGAALATIVFIKAFGHRIKNLFVKKSATKESTKTDN